MLISLKSSPVAIQRRGPTARDIPPTSISKIPDFNPSYISTYLSSEELDLYDKRKQASELNEEDEDSDEHLPSLETIPTVFFDKQFALNNPKTFTTASSIDISDALDVIEQHLTSQLFKKASSLGESFVEIKEVHSKSKELSLKLDGLINSLNSLLKSSNRDDLILLLIKRSNIMKLQLAQLHLISISKSLKSIKLAINDTNLDEALDLIISTKPLLSDLPRSNSIVITTNHLNSLQSTVGHGYANMMVELTLRDILLVDFDPITTFQGILNKSNDTKLISQETTTKIIDLIDKLNTCNEIQYAFKLFHESIISHFRSIYKSNFAQDESISDLTPLEFENCLINFISHFNNSCMLLNNLKSIFLSIDLPNETQYLDISPSITTAINYTIKRISRAFKLRELQSIRLSLPYFLRFNKLSNIMLKQSELLSNGLANDFQLRQLIEFQLKTFISDFHKSSKSQAQLAIRRELWKDEGLPNDLQLIIDEITSPSKELINWTKGFNLNFDNEQLIKPTSEMRKTLIINDQSFILPPSITPLLHTVKSYLILNSVYPQYSPIIQSYLPDTLNMINDTIHSSVLGTEAMKTAGLKHISTRVVALAAEVCRFWSEVSFQLLKFTSQKKFDSIKIKFNDQLIAYYEKLVSIMHDVILKLIPVDNYMEEIIKKILSIAKSIHRYFPDMEYQMLMSRIFLDYEEVLSDFFMKNINENNRAAFQNDVKYFMDKLNDVVGESGVGKRLWVLVGGDKLKGNEKLITHPTLVVENENETEKESSVNSSVDSLPNKVEESVEPEEVDATNLEETTVAPVTEAESVIEEFPPELDGESNDSVEPELPIAQQEEDQQVEEDNIKQVAENGVAAKEEEKEDVADPQEIVEHDELESNNDSPVTVPSESTTDQEQTVETKISEHIPSIMANVPESRVVDSSVESTTAAHDAHSLKVETKIDEKVENETESTSNETNTTVQSSNSKRKKNKKKNKKR